MSIKYIHGGSGSQMLHAAFKIPGKNRRVDKKGSLHYLFLCKYHNKYRLPHAFHLTIKFLQLISCWLIKTGIETLGVVQDSWMVSAEKFEI